MVAGAAYIKMWCMRQSKGGGVGWSGVAATGGGLLGAMGQGGIVGVRVEKVPWVEIFVYGVGRGQASQLKKILML